MDTSFGNGDGLLLHGLVDRDLIFHIHLIELINAADAVISEHQSSSLNAELTRLWVLPHISRQACGRRGLTTAIDGSRQELADVFEELGLGSCWVSHDADVNVTSQLDAITRVLFDSTKQLQQDALLDIKMTIDTRSDRLGQLCVEILLVLH